MEKVVKHNKQWSPFKGVVRTVLCHFHYYVPMLKPLSHNDNNCIVHFSSSQWQPCTHYSTQVKSSFDKYITLALFSSHRVACHPDISYYIVLCLPNESFMWLNGYCYLMGLCSLFPPSTDHSSAKLLGSWIDDLIWAVAIVSYKPRLWTSQNRSD